MDVWKTILVALAAAAVIAYLNNRYRLPVIGLTDEELAKMAERSETKEAAASAVGQ